MSTPKTPPPPPRATDLPGGPDRIIQICEELRGRNTDGYVAGVGGMLANIKNAPGLPIPPACNATTCSPFSATVIGVAFDPKYPRDDLGGSPYEPMFNGGTEALPFHAFYSLHNANDSAIKSVVQYGLATEIDVKKLRRGDLLEISWYPKGGGHIAFCWDVHLDDAGDVDAIQILASNGPSPGVSIYGCRGAPWLSGKNGSAVPHTKEVLNKKTKQMETKTYSTLGRGDLQKIGGKDAKIFVDDDEIVHRGAWLGLLHVKTGSVRLDTFRKAPKRIIYANSEAYAFMGLRAARFHYTGDPPAPFCMKDGPPAPPKKPGHVDTPAVVVKGADLKKDPGAPQKVPTKPAKQEKNLPLEWQHGVEAALRMFHDAKWIESDPGKSENLNDAASKAAIKEYQRKFKLDDDGVVGPKTLGSMREQIVACSLQFSAQLLLGALFRGKKLQNDPGPPDGVHNPKISAAVEELQKANGLVPTRVPDAATAVKLLQVVNGHAPTPAKAGLEPQVNHLYWVGNRAEVGGKATLRMHCKDLKIGQKCAVHLEDLVSKKKVDATVTLDVDRAEPELVLTLPVDFARGARVLAHVTVEVGGASPLDVATSAPLAIGGGTETALWRPYIGKDEVPTEVLDAIRRNRAQYPMKTFKSATGKWAGEYHYDYKPAQAHKTWAESWARKKLVAADASGNRAESHIAASFLHMLSNEGLPASFMTYDNQIITWGVGLGGLGDGKDAFTRLDGDPAMKKLLDDLGMSYDASTVDYHVVDLNKKKVITTRPPRKGEGRGEDTRHIVALQACREQKDLMSALIGMSEDPATRDAVIESQWAVYLSNSTKWPGQDKIYSLALFFMITHMYQWMPALGKYGTHVEKEFAAIGGGTPSAETDRKIAPRIALSFIAYAKVYRDLVWAQKKKKFDYDDIRTRTKTRLWAQFRTDAKKEGFDPGELTYED